MILKGWNEEITNEQREILVRDGISNNNDAENSLINNLKTTNNNNNHQQLESAQQFLLALVGKQN